MGPFDEFLLSGHDPSTKRIYLPDAFGIVVFLHIWSRSDPFEERDPGIGRVASLVPYERPRTKRRGASPFCRSSPTGPGAPCNKHHAGRSTV